MMFRKYLIGLALPVIAVASEGGIERQLGAHVHGEGVVSVAQDGNRFELELELPGANIVGFEHAPRDAAEAAALEQTLAWLGDGGHWLLPDPRGGCAQASVKVHTHGYGDKAGEHDNPGHGHHHDHSHRDHAHEHREHDHGHHDHDHAEFHLVAVLECAHADRLGWIDLDLFERFPGNEVLVTSIFTQGGQGQVRLHAGDIRVAIP